MKRLHTPRILVLLFLLFCFGKNYSQRISNEYPPVDSLAGFNYLGAMDHTLHMKTDREKFLFLNHAKRTFKISTYNLYPEPNSGISAKGDATNGTLQGPQPAGCANIDFESQNITNWTVTGDRTIVTGGVDPYGGFPKVWPGGTASLKLNDDNITGTKTTFSAQASRVIPVTAANSQFQLHFAFCILNYPHPSSAAAAFYVQFFDQSNNLLTCPQFQCYYANPPGAFFGMPAGVAQTAPVTGQNIGFQVYPVTYVPWQTVAMDLTPYIGTNVTAKITCNWCAYNYDWGYCYIDADCASLTATLPGTVCPGTICGPPGMMSYTWTPPVGPVVTTSCIAAATPGTYTLAYTPFTTCGASIKTATYVVVPNPISTFSSVNACGNYTFTNTGTGAPAVQTYSFVGVGAPASFTTTAVTSPVAFPTAGTYTVVHTVTNATGCSTTTSLVIVVPATPNPAFTFVSPQCLNGNSFTFVAANGAGVQTYSFNPVAGAPAVGNTATYGPVSFTAPGSYTVTHTINTGGCTNITTSVVVINPQPSATITQTNATCGNNNGVIIITNTSPVGQTVTGFTFDGGAIATQTIINVAAGTHTIGLTNNFGCTITYTVNITNTPPITALATTSINPTCGNANGSIGLGVVTGGTPTYSYSVNGGPYTAVSPITNLAAGSYTIGVIDSKGCTFVKTVVITNVPGPTALTFTTAPNTCLGGAGSVTIGVTGGTPAYSYSIDAVASGNTATGLSTGTHTVIVKDANGCTITSTFIIGVVAGPTAATVVVTNATCGGANGSATVTTVTGGLAPYQYSFNGGPFSGTNNIGGLTVGTKTVVVKDANGCTYTVNFVIANPGSPTASIAASNSVICNGGATGSFTVNTVGGTPGYGYTITPTNATNGIGIFTGVTAQIYTVTVKDAAGCVTTTTVNIAQPTPLTLTLTPTAVSCNAGNNGSITAVGAGGTAPYQYSLNGGAYQASGNFTGLIAGTYSVTVKDNNGCTLTQTSIITQPTALALTFTTTPNSCVGAAGSVTMGVTGGTPVYSYSIDATASANTATGLSSGTHTALVKDANGCLITATFNIGVVTGPTVATVVTSNATCGNANGSATVTSVTGGLAPYQYSFNGGGFTATNNVGGLTAGTQTVVIKDVNGCTLTVTYNINNTGSPTASISATSNVLCNGGANGSFTVNTSGGTPGYNYTITPGGTTNATGIFTGLTAQSYNVSIKDAVGCITTVTVTITQPTPLTLTLTPTPVSCNAGNNGSITAVGGGGTAPYQYSLNGGAYQASGNFTGLIAGTYSITVKDNNNCTFLQTTIITQPTALALTFNTIPNSCAGSVGSATLNASGGTPVYSYSVDALASVSTPTGLATGTHTATIVDANGCVKTGTFNIGVVLGPSAATITTTNANCGGSNGSATVTIVAGGVGPYQYSFNGGPFSTTNLIGGLTAGTKTVTIIDANGCTLTLNFVIGNTGSPVSSIGGIGNVSCNGGANGTFTVNTGGGTPGYSYTLTPGNITSGTGMFSGLAAGAYNINVQDAAGCVTTVSVNITQPTAVTLSLTSTATSCNGGNDGTITASSSGGTGPYQFSLNGGAYQAATTFTGVAAGVYNITVKDNNGCTLTASVSVTQPSAIALTFSSINANCTSANGTASVNATGGTPAYTYTWSGGGGNASQTTGLVSGTYTVTVADSKGCIKTGVTTINFTPGGTAVITSSTNVTCFGFNNGTMTAGTTGAMVAPLSYLWSNGQITQTATNLPPGVYTCTITDVYGCKASISGAITQPGILDFAINTSSVTCFNGNNGSGTVTYLGGGTPGFTYLWAAGGATTTTASNLPQGNYTCTITDANGCILTKTATVTQPTSVTITSTVTTANCNQSNGSATVTASGGTPVYSYTWSTGATGPVLSGAAAGTYTIQIKDANGCLFTSAATVPNSAGPSMAITGFTNVSCFGGNNGVATTTVTGGAAPYVYLWSNGQNTGTGTNLPAGVYTATVTDINGCKASTSVTINQPSVLTVSVSGANPKCFGSLNGTANAGVLGGTAGYTYTWTPTGGNGSSAAGLGAGNYIVTVTDANGCIASSSIALANPPQMTAAITSTNVTCFGACNGMANGTAANTVGVVTWFWIGGPGPLTTQNITNLCAGNYTMSATDQNGCTATASVLVTQPPQITASITAQGNASCAGYTNGFATATPAGGTPAYNYSWTPSGGTLATASNLSAGAYVVTITDAKGCSTTANVTITQPAALQSTLTVTNITCNGLNNGTGNVAYSGGTGPYTFLWLPTLNNTASVNNLPPGTHTVQITDNLGCITTTVATVTQPTQLTAAVTASNSNCTQANGAACVTAGGGAGGYSYQWSSNPTFTNSCIINVVAGAYSITVTDANGCTATGIANINDISGPVVVVTATTSVSCFGGSNGSATTNISGGVAPVTVLWSYLAQTTQNVNNLPAGLHSITVKDAAGCVSSASVNIIQPPLLVSAITNVQQINCNGANNGSATMLLNGGTPAYSYTWTPSLQTSSVAVSMGPGTYTCFVTDNNGCPTSQVVTITQPAPLVITSAVVTNVACSGGNTGAIATTITGGTPAYVLLWNPLQPANAVITNLAAGSYTLLVTDTKSCTTTGSYIITQPVPMVTAATSTPATCGNANGSATVTVNGGTPGYTYSWNTPPPQSTAVATNMAANTWICTITDNNGCIATQSVAVANAPGPNITSMTFTAPLCFGQLNGSMGVNFTSGTAPYTFVWNNPGASNTQVVSGVGAGVYSATVTDLYGCTASGVVNVTQPNQLLLNVSPDPTICYGQSTQIYGAGAGGTPAYTYSWNPATFVGGGPISVNPLTTTQYTVFVTDNNGCNTSPVIITVNVKPPLLANGYSVTKCDGATAFLHPNITSPGNGSPYTYQWSNGAVSQNITVTANYLTNPNTYSVIIKDGCTIPDGVANFTVNVNPLPSGTFTADVLKGCAPLSVNFFANSSSPTDTYVWEFGGNNLAGNGSPVHVEYPNAGVYSVTLQITNSFGCKKDTAVANYIEVYPQPFADFVANPALTSILEPGIHFTNYSTGAVSYWWDFGDFGSTSNNSTFLNPDHDYTYAGVYLVHLIATSIHGCSDTAAHSVEITPDFVIYIPNAFTPDGNGKNEIFQPVGVGIDEENYRMYIFDRWGELIFTSDNFRKGWDGTVKGNKGIAEQGVYVYKIYVRDIMGNDHEYVGHVTCLPKDHKH